MCIRYVAFFFILGTLAWSVPNSALAVTVFYTQIDASVQSTLPPRNNGIGQVFISAASGNARTIVIRTTPSNNGSADCSKTSNGNIMRLALWPANATSSQSIDHSLNYAWFSASSTAPDVDGNCFYNFYHTDNFYNEFFPPFTRSSSGTVTDSALIAGNTYMVAIDDQYLRWDHDSFGGSSSGSGAGSLDGPGVFTLGGVGVSSYFMTISDTLFYVDSPAPPPDPCAVPGACVSNVLFLPGIEGSRLYEGVGCGKAAEEKLWEPIADSLLQILRGAGNDKARNLFLTQSGASVCGDIYAKADDIVDSVRGNNIYRSFIDEMNGLEADGIINDWKPVAYDWRLSLPDLLHKGAERDGKIFYAGGNESATSTPYIEQTLRALAGSSQTGKVTIVAHSNGGLVAKALLNELGDAEAATLVDKVLMVGAPQSGAPEALGATLVGHNAGIYKYGFPILSNAVARELAQNSPMAYHLLPSGEYLVSIAADTAHLVARFAGDGYTKEISAYGSTIDNKTELDNFLLATEGGREKPVASNVDSAEILNSSLLEYANGQHDILDAWTPPAGIEVSQIAGWGIDTVAGIDFYTPQPINVLTALEPMRKYNPIFTEDGDGTVPVPSALLMASSTNVKKYWVNLDSYRKETSIRRTHRDLFEIPSFEDFIKNIIKNSTSTLPAYLSTSQPAPLTENKKLTFFLHSPLTLELTDSSGNVTGLAEDDSMTQDIPDSAYGEFGEVKYVTVPEGDYTLSMSGQASGTFSLDMQESSGGIITASSTIANVPTTASTLASLTISGGLDTVSALTVDQNGDGENIITITPQIGETINYEPPVPEPVVSSSGRGGGWESLSLPVLAATTSTETFATATSILEIEPIATETSTIAIFAKPLQTRQKSPKPVFEPSKKVNVNISQTGSVYEASQQSISAQLGRVVYNGLHRFWRGLKVIFLIQK